MRRKAFRRRAIRSALVASNVAVLAVIMLFVLHNPSSADTGLVSSSASAESVAANPLDEVSSADIALTVARMGNLPETTAVSNQAQSQAAEVNQASTTNNVVTKPQVVATALKSSADIKEYTVTAGDTVPIIASKFNITSESVRWSNNLTADSVTAGTKLVIPPVNGIVYTVAANDTPDSLAAKFHASKDKIIAYNDAEIKGLVPGQRIIIPDGSQVAARVSTSNSSSASANVAWGFSAVYAGAGGYDYGYCTYYAAGRSGAPSNWGNANTWAYYAPASGWTVSKTPVQGAIGQTTAGYFGHVAIVEAVSADGTMIKYSDMNGLAGWGRVGYSDWAPASRFMNYIYR